MEGMYPPEPWHLRGQLWLSVFAVPRSAIPALPAGIRPVVFGGRVLVGAAWVRYEPGGTLHYRELLSAVLVRNGVSVLDIWVDSAQSRDGGRALWGIPKELADIAIPEAVTGARGIPVPGRWPVVMSIVQAFGDGVRRTPVRGTTRVRLRGRVPADGRFGYLAGHRPLWTVGFEDFRLRFGRSPGTP
jgi:hypothetical protein